MICSALCDDDRHGECRWDWCACPCHSGCTCWDPDKPDCGEIREAAEHAEAVREVPDAG